MLDVLLIGNPNVGKTTLFNSLTKSSEHTGNFHGVTVEEKFKVVKFESEEYRIFDLPGIYSLNTYSYEEDVSKKFILKNSGINLVLIDANSLRKNLYLCQQLNELGINYKILINNLNNFQKNKNFINLNKLKIQLNTEIIDINAKKIKINKNLIKNLKNNKNTYKYLENIVEKIRKIKNISKNKIINCLNGIFDDLNKEEIKLIESFKEEIVSERYKYIDSILKECLSVDENFYYGESKFDKFLLNPFVMIVGFCLFFFASLYFIFFGVGTQVSELLTSVCNGIIINPLSNLICFITDNIWVIEFFNQGVLNSFTIILSFLPQVVLMFVFLTLLEDSGIVSRLAFVVDGFLTKFGLNGKAIYIMLMGLGCNTASTMLTRNMSDKNMKTKMVILNPYISCMARLPIFVIIASTFFSKTSFFIIAGLYVLGFFVALILSAVLNKKILKSKTSSMLLEFAPLKFPDLKHIVQVVKLNAVDMVKRLISVIVCVSVIVWLLTHTTFTFQYTQSIQESILFLICDKLSFLFSPIGLNNAGIVCALFVGIMAKELIVSTMSICNNAIGTNELVSSLIISSSVVSFSRASAVSFLIFSLLYSPCASNLAVIKQETDKFTMWLCVLSQFVIAYIISFVAYNFARKGFLFGSLLLVIFAIIVISFIFVIKKAKHNKCLACGKCKK